MPDENVYTEAHGFKFPNGTTIPIEDAEARESISEINQSLSQLWASSQNVTNQDFNSLPLGIIYNSGNCANSPISGTVYMLVLTIAINNTNLPKAQFAIDFNGTNANSDIYFRNQTAGTWRAWKKLNNS